VKWTFGLAVARAEDATGTDGEARPCQGNCSGESVMRLYRCFLCLILCVVAGIQASPQELKIEQGALTDDASIARAMPELAEQVMARYAVPDRDRYLDNLFRLQIVAGQYERAIDSLQSLTELRRVKDPASVWRVLADELLAKARMKQSGGGLTLDEAFKLE